VTDLVFPHSTPALYDRYMGPLLFEPNSIDTGVLIVGAGPVGLFLANECARRNLRWHVIEERSSQSEHSKALAIFPRTLEIFDMVGIVAPLKRQIA